MNKCLSQVVLLSILTSLFFLTPLSVEALEIPNESESSIQITGKIGKKRTDISEQESEKQQQLVIDNSAIQRKQLPKLASYANKFAWFGWIMILCWLLYLSFRTKKEL